MSWWIVLDKAMSNSLAHRSIDQGNLWYLELSLVCSEPWLAKQR